MKLSYETKVRQAGKNLPTGIYSLRLDFGRRTFSVGFKASMKNQKWLWRKRRLTTHAMERQWQIWRLMFGTYTRRKC